MNVQAVTTAVAITLGAIVAIMGVDWIVDYLRKKGILPPLAESSVVVQFLDKFVDALRKVYNETPLSEVGREAVEAMARAFWTSVIEPTPIKSILTLERWLSFVAKAYDEIAREEVAQARMAQVATARAMKVGGQRADERSRRG